MTLTERWEKYKKLSELEAKLEGKQHLIRLCYEAFVAGCIAASSTLCEEAVAASKEMNQVTPTNWSKL